MKNAGEYAKLFHSIYEAYAPKYGYTTREDTREFDARTPNGKLMIRVVSFIIDKRDQEIISEIEKKIVEVNKKEAQNNGTLEYLQMAHQGRLDAFTEIINLIKEKK